MAVSVELTKTALSLKLNNGLTPSGVVKTLSVSLGSFDKDKFDVAKVWNITEALLPCLSKSMIPV